MAKEASVTTASPAIASSPDHKRTVFHLDSDARQSNIGSSSNSEAEFIEDEDTTEGSAKDVEKEDELARDLKRPRLEDSILSSDGDDGYIFDKGEDQKESEDAINIKKGTPENTEHVVDVCLPKEEEIESIRIKNREYPIHEFISKEEVTQCVVEAEYLQKDNETKAENFISPLKENEGMAPVTKINEFSNSPDEDLKEAVGGVAAGENGYELVKEMMEEKPVVGDVLLGEHENSYERGSKTEITENKEAFLTDMNDLKGFPYMDGHQNSSVQQQSFGSSRQPESLSESHNFEQTRKMEVPREKVGVLIGKGGDNIRYLQHNSGARIQIVRENDLNPYSSVREVDIIGSLESINKAEKLIKDVITEAEAGGSPSLVARGGATAYSTSVVEQMQMQVPNEKVGVIIGKGGETIKGLQSRSGARIQVLIPPHFPEGDQSRERIVRITGDRKQIEMAREMINEVMNQPSRPPGSGGYRHQAYRPRPPTAAPSQFLPQTSTNPYNPHPSSRPASQNLPHPDFYSQQPASTESPNFPAPSLSNPANYPHTNHPYPHPNQALFYDESTRYCTQPQQQTQPRPSLQPAPFYGMQPSAQASPVSGYGAQQMGYGQGCNTAGYGYYGTSDATAAAAALTYTQQQGYPQSVVAQQQQASYSQQLPVNPQHQMYSQPGYFQNTSTQQVYSQPLPAAAMQVYSQSVPAVAAPAQQIYPQQTVVAATDVQPVYMQQGYAQPGSAGQQQCYAQPGSAGQQQQCYAQPGSAGQQQCYAQPGSAGQQQQCYAQPGSAGQQQYYAQPGSAVGQQYYTQPVSAAPQQCYSQPQQQQQQQQVYAQSFVANQLPSQPNE